MPLALWLVKVSPCRAKSLLRPMLTRRNWRNRWTLSLFTQLLNPNGSFHRSSCCANVQLMKSPSPVAVSTFVPSQRSPSFTRDSSTPTSCGSTTLTFSTPNSTLTWHSCTLDSAQTLSHHGNELIRCVSWRTTARSTRSVATSTLWRLARVSWKATRLVPVRLSWAQQLIEWFIVCLLTDLKKLYPVVEPNLSDSGSADCCVEFLAIAGKRSLPEVSIKYWLPSWF